MGCCDSKPRNIKQTQIGDTMKSANTPKLNSKYEPRITYTGNNSLNSKYSLKTKIALLHMDLLNKILEHNQYIIKISLLKMNLKKWKNIIII